MQPGLRMQADPYQFCYLIILNIYAAQITLLPFFLDVLRTKRICTVQKTNKTLTFSTFPGN